MLNGGALDHRVEWDQWILTVYSVLVGLTLDKSFDFFTTSDNKIASAILLVSILIVVLENWIYLPIYFKVINVDLKIEVWMYIFAAISYSCLPGLYIARNQAPILSAPLWILLNFAFICFVDSITKLITINKLIKKDRNLITKEEKFIIGDYSFYMISGFFYASLLTLETIILSHKFLDPILMASIVTGSWLVIRAFDKIFIKTISLKILSFLMININEQTLDIGLSTPNQETPIT